MSHFYGTVQGGRTEATRCGHKTTGITAEAKGWDLGGKIVMKYYAPLDTDILYLYATRGNGASSKLIGSYLVKDGVLTSVDINYPEVLV